MPTFFVLFAIVNKHQTKKKKIKTKQTKKKTNKKHRK
jgi:hypothetical protein